MVHFKDKANPLKKSNVYGQHLWSHIVKFRHFRKVWKNPSDSFWGDDRTLNLWSLILAIIIITCFSTLSSFVQSSSIFGELFQREHFWLY